MVNVGASLRLDLSEDPPLSSYTPIPVSPLDEDEISDDSESTETEEEQRWYHRGEARIYVRGAPRAYSAPQTFFDDVLDQAEISRDELAELHEAFESKRPTANSIFDLFDELVFCADHDEYERGGRLHVDALHVFTSEDDDGAPQHTWVHTRDIQAVEVPTRLWELHCLSVKARSEVLEARPARTERPARRQKRGTGRPR
jgi:hypothetical protein